MSKKPDGTSGPKAAKASVYTSRTKKPNALARRNKAIETHGKKMAVPRGTERARRRVGLHQGWKNEQGREVVRMLPAKNLEVVHASTHSVTLCEETVNSINKLKAAAKEAAKKDATKPARRILKEAAPC